MNATADKKQNTSDHTNKRNYKRSFKSFMPILKNYCLRNIPKTDSLYHYNHLSRLIEAGIM